MVVVVPTVRETHMPDTTHLSRDDILAELAEARDAMRELVGTINAQATRLTRQSTDYAHLVHAMYAMANDFAARAADTAVPAGALADSHLERMRTWAQASEMLRDKLRVIGGLR
jgi:methyl-accepting chemotaxis protein